MEKAYRSFLVDNGITITSSTTKVPNESPTKTNENFGNDDDDVIIIDTQNKDERNRRSDESIKVDDPKLTSTPVVYTTRIDEMFVVNNARFGDRKKIIRQIYRESKPKFGDPMFRKIFRRNKQIHLNKKLRFLKKYPTNSVDNTFSNSVVTHRTYSKDRSTRAVLAPKEPFLTESVRMANAKLLELCKPLTIRLERIPDMPSQEGNICLETQLNDGNQTKKYRQMIATKTAKKTISLILTDTSRNETDIYYIENTSLIDRFVQAGVEKSLIEPYIRAYRRAGIDTIVKNFCCWENRSTFILTLPSQFYPDTLKKLMFKPHYCPFGKCNCCCSLELSPNSDDDVAKISFEPDIEKSNTCLDKEHSEGKPEDNMEIIELDDDEEITQKTSETKQSSYEYGYNIDWLQDLLRNNSSNTLINNALNYDPITKPILKNNVWNNQPVNQDVDKLCKSRAAVKSFHDENSHDVKFFKMSENGLMEMYLKEPFKCESYLSALFSKDTESPSPVVDEKAICCWQKREQLIQNISYEYPVLAKFLKTSHTCLPKHCQCCCRTPKLEKLIILKDIPSTENFISKRFSVFEESKISLANEAEHVLKSSEKSLNNKTPHNFEVNEASTNQFNKATGPSNNKNITSWKPEVSNKAVISNTTTAGDHLKSNVKVSKVIPNQPKTQQVNITKMPIINSISDQSPVVDSMISSILERFKDVRLTINDEGKVAAALNVPVNTLSTAELKVLANILAHAQAQVQAIRVGQDIQISDRATNISNNPITSVQPNLIQNTLHTDSSNVNTTSAASSINLMNDIETAKSVNLPAQTQNQLFTNMSQIMWDKNQTFISSFDSYVRSIKDDDETTPVISNVFSLKDTNELDNNFSEQIKNQKVITENTSVGQLTRGASLLKRASETEQRNSSSKPKIRVVDPVKLGITEPPTLSMPNKTVKILNEDFGASRNINNFGNRMNLEGGQGNATVIPNLAIAGPSLRLENMTIGSVENSVPLQNTMVVNTIHNAAGMCALQTTPIYFVSSPHNVINRPVLSTPIISTTENINTVNNVSLLRPFAPNSGQANASNSNLFQYRIDNLDTASNPNSVKLVPLLPTPPLAQKSKRGRKRQ